MAKRPNVKLTERDIRLLVDLYKMRYLSVSEINRLCFPSEQTTYRRLRLLKSHNLLKSFNAPGVDESIYYLAKGGAELVAANLQVTMTELGWKEAVSVPKDYYFLKHFLAINDFRISLTRSCDSSSVSLLGFIPEHLGVRTSKGGMMKYIRDIVSDVRRTRDDIRHTPDAVFALQNQGKAALFFLEIDRGTEIVSNVEKGVLRSVRFYVSYLASGKYQRYARDFRVDQFRGFRTLYVTTSHQRVENIRTTASEFAAPQKAKQLLWISTFGDIEKRGPLDDVWLCLDKSEPRRFAILPK